MDFEEPKARIQCLRGDLLVLSRGVVVGAVIAIAVDDTSGNGCPF